MSGKATAEEFQIRGVCRSDIPSLNRLMTNERVIWGTTVMPYQSEFALEAALLQGNRHWLIAADSRRDVVLGYLYLTWGQGRWRRIASLVMGVSDARCGQGIGTALVNAALRVGFRYLDLQRIELEVYSDNDAAIALYRRCGFVHEGTKRRNAIRDGVFVDGHVMSILDTEDRSGSPREDQHDQ